MLSEPVKTNTLKIRKYTTADKKVWNELVAKSRNGTFLLNRDYMDYHADRFTDCSFIFTKKDSVEAILPGNIVDNTFYSHQGLTYGGLLISDKVTTIDILEIFDLLTIELRKLFVTEIIYKPIPFFYHRSPSQEDIYALFRMGAEKIGCNISSAIYQSNKLGFNELRKRGVKRGLKSGIQVIESEDFNTFCKILNENLTRKFGKTAVHSGSEITMLNNRFRNNIRLHVAVLGDDTNSKNILAGVVTFCTPYTVHVQYISTTEAGRELGALDLIFYKLINETYANIPVFEFGQSTEHMGKYLNHNLIFQKEGFGARGVVYDIYKLNVPY